MFKFFFKVISAFLALIAAFIGGLSNFFGNLGGVETTTGISTTTTTQPTSTTVTNPSTVSVTYEDSSDTGIWYVDALGRGLTTMEQEAVRQYSYDADKDYYFINDKDCWQYGFGYNEIYDQMAPITVMFIDEVRINFDYDDRAWMIQLWKGQYGWVFVGAEIGIYATESFTTSEIDESDINHYKCANHADWLNMDMHFYWDDDRDGQYSHLFSKEYAKYWWMNGYKFGTLNRFSSPITELRMTSHITFKDEIMATLFTKGMKKNGFTSASSKDTLSYDSIYQSGADVWFDWRSVNGTALVENNNSSERETVIIGDKSYYIGESGEYIPVENNNSSESKTVIIGDKAYYIGEPGEYIPVN